MAKDNVMLCIDFLLENKGAIRAPFREKVVGLLNFRNDVIAQHGFVKIDESNIKENLTKLDVLNTFFIERDPNFWDRFKSINRAQS